MIVTDVPLPDAPWIKRAHTKDPSREGGKFFFCAAISVPSLSIPSKETNSFRIP